MAKATALLSMADIHYGKRTKSYSPDVFKERLARLVDSLADAKRLVGADVDRLVVAALGDWNDGTDIYKTQPHHQAETNVEAQANELSDLLAPFLARLKQQWGEVDVYCVPGNHGRASRFANEAANWDIVTYRYLQLKVKDAGVRVHVPTPDELFIRKVAIKGRTVLMYHGHDIRTYSNIPWYGMHLRLIRWLSTNLTGFDTALMGHFHTFGHWELNRVDLYLNGTMVTDDEWALQSLGWESSPRWHLLGLAEGGAVPWRFVVDTSLGTAEAEALTLRTQLAAAEETIRAQARLLEERP